MNEKNLRDLIPAYALGALDPDERAEVEAWLSTDSEARTLLAEYQSLADHLVLSVPARPAPDHLSADLRHRLLVERSQQQTLPAYQMEHQPRSGRKRWWYALPAAAILLLLLLGIVLQFSEENKTSRAEKLYKQLSNQEDARLLELARGENQEQVWGYLVVSPEGKQAVICVWDLPVLTSNQAFELWLVDNNGIVRSGGTFQTDTPEAATYIEVPIERPIEQYQQFGVSIEPAEGSPLGNQPSGPRVFYVRLS